MSKKVVVRSLVAVMVLQVMGLCGAQSFLSAARRATNAAKTVVRNISVQPASGPQSTGPISLRLPSYPKNASLVVKEAPSINKVSKILQIGPRIHKYRHLFTTYKNNPEIRDATLDFMLPSVLAFGLGTYYLSGQAERLDKAVAYYEAQGRAEQQRLIDQYLYFLSQLRWSLDDAWKEELKTKIAALEMIIDAEELQKIQEEQRAQEQLRKQEQDAREAREREESERNRLEARKRMQAADEKAAAAQALRIKNGELTWIPSGNDLR